MEHAIKILEKELTNRCLEIGLENIIQMDKARNSVHEPLPNFNSRQDPIVNELIEAINKLREKVE